jgi:hypothetical protein
MKPTTHDHLTAAYADRDDAHAKLHNAAQAVERASRIEAAAAGHVRDLEQCSAHIETIQAGQLAERIAAGPADDTIEMVDGDAAAALAAARSDESIKSKALATLKAAHAQRQSDLAAAERAVVDAVDRILHDEMVERARSIERHLDEARRLGLALKYFAVAAGIHGSGVIPTSVQRAIDRLGAPLINTLDTPIHLEALGDVAAFRDWTARREQMIAGEAPVKEASAA